MRALFDKRSKVLFACAVVGAMYSIYLCSYFSDAAASDLGGAIATALVTPHIIFMTLGTVFACLGFFLRAPWGACVAGILYCVGAVIFMAYAMLAFPMIVLAFIGFVMQKKLARTPPPADTEE